MRSRVLTMFTKVWHWLLLAVGSLFAGPLIGSAVFMSHPHGGATAEYSLIVTSLFTFLVPLIGLKGAWRTFREGWQERVRMNQRDRRYGQPRGVKTWHHDAWQRH